MRYSVLSASATCCSDHKDGPTSDRKLLLFLNKVEPPIGHRLGKQQCFVKNSHYIRPSTQSAKEAKLLPPMTKHPSQATVNMAILFEKIPRNKMALRFAQNSMD